MNRIATGLALSLVTGVLVLRPSGQAPSGVVIALTGARLIDGTGRPALSQATVLIRDGRIEAVGQSGAVSIPPGAMRVDATGKTILPGLINAHGHLNNDNSSKPIREKLAGQLRVYADYGVTTVVVLGTGPNDLQDAVQLRDEQERGPLARARVYVAGPSLRHDPHRTKNGDNDQQRDNGRDNAFCQVHGYSLGYTRAVAPSICMTSTLVPTGITSDSS